MAKNYALILVARLPNPKSTVSNPRSAVFLILGVFFPNPTVGVLFLIIGALFLIPRALFLILQLCFLTNGQIPNVYIYNK